MPDWRDPLLWKVGIIMSAANQLYFCTNVSSGLSSTDRPHRPDRSGAHRAQCRAIAGIFHPACHGKPVGAQEVAAAAAVAIGVLGVAGTLAFTGTWGVVLSAALIGFACAVILTLVLALPALLIVPDDVPRMSAGVFTLGYGLAMTMSILGGIAWDISGKAMFAFLPVTVWLLPAVILIFMTDLSQRRA
jgi:CP family cyanate transporter-like MFS transporter